MNMFLVETPHQVLNALEARHRFGLHQADLTITLLAEYPQAAYTPILKESGWDNVSFVPHTNVAIGRLRRGKLGPWISRASDFYADLRCRRGLDALAKRSGRVRNLFLGNYGRSHMRHFANRAGCAQVYLLDDGTATLSVNQTRRLLDLKPEHRPTVRSVTRLRTRLIGYDDRHLKRVTFFTTYDLEPARSDWVVKNDYRYLRSLAARHEPSDEVFFVGQPLVEDGLVLPETFFSCMAEVVRNFEGSKLIYLAHQREHSAKTLELKRRCGVDTKRFDVPIEYQMSVRGPRPRALASFFSSAIENSRILFGSVLPVHCFFIKPENFLQSWDRISSIYSYFLSKQNEHFSVIELPASDNGSRLTAAKTSKRSPGVALAPASRP